MKALLEFGFNNAVTAALLALMVALIVRRKSHPAIAHALWLLVLAKLVTPPLVRLDLPAWMSLSDDRPDAVASLDAAGPLREASAQQVNDSLESSPMFDPFSLEAVLRSDDRSQPPERGTEGPDRQLVTPTTREPAPPNSERATHSSHRPSGLEQSAGSGVLIRSGLPRDIDWRRFWPMVFGAAWLTGSIVWMAMAALRIVQFQRLLRQASAAPPAIAREVARSPRGSAWPVRPTR